MVSIRQDPVSFKKNKELKLFIFFSVKSKYNSEKMKVTAFLRNLLRELILTRVSRQNSHVERKNRVSKKKKEEARFRNLSKLLTQLRWENIFLKSNSNVWQECTLYSCDKAGGDVIPRHESRREQAFAHCVTSEP